QPALVVQDVEAGARVLAAVVVHDELPHHLLQALERGIAADEPARPPALRDARHALGRMERRHLRRLVGAVRGVRADRRSVLEGDDLLADVVALPADDDFGIQAHQSALNFICVLPKRKRSPSLRRVGCTMRWLLTKVPLVEPRSVTTKRPPRSATSAWRVDT